MARLRHLFLLFFLSGVSGLIYESLWSRYLRLFVGSASTAQILVLALFMGGMSAGAFLAGRKVERLRRPILTYGVIEGAVGLYALAFPLLFGVATRICYDHLFPAVGGSGVPFVKWTVATLLVAPPCVLLGTTFPLMSVGILRREPTRSGEVLSFLYFSNSLGASIGAILSGFVLVPFLGLPYALSVAAGLNLLIMVVALRERREHAPLLHGTEPPEAAENSRTAADPLLMRLMLAIALGTGLSSFMYEVSWIRLLAMILGSATHSFEVMLSAFVFGLAAGGLWVRKRMDRFPRPERALAIVQIVMGVAAISTLPLYRVAVYAMSGVLSISDQRTMAIWVLFNVVRYLLCLLIMFPATFCAGMTLPLATHVLLRRGHSESAVGRVYGINTLGSIVGAIAGGLLLMPLIGLHRVIMLGAAIDMGLGVWILNGELRKTASRAFDDPRKKARVVKARSRERTQLAIGCALITGLSLFLVRPEPRILAAGVFRRGRVRVHEDYVPLLHVDGRTATVTVMQDSERPGYHSLYTNGKPDASVFTERYPQGRDRALGPVMAGDEPTQILCGALPLLTNPSAKRAAVIGMGSGVTSHVLLASPILERLDTVEIEPQMAEGAKLFSPINDRTFHDPRSHVVFDDAKAYFASAESKYDIIVSEPSNPWVSGVSSLFTVEFYREVKRYMAEGAVLGQWIHGYELGDSLLLGVLAALNQEFQHYRIYRIGERDWLFLASMDRAVPDLDDGPIEAWPDLGAELGTLGIHDIGQLDTLLIADERLMRPLLSTKTPNRDIFPLLDNGAEKARFFRLSAEFLNKLRFNPLPLVEVMGGIERRPYPQEGIPRGWEKHHILWEPDKAKWLLDTFARGELESPNTAAMRVYLRQRENVMKPSAEPVDWQHWFYGVFAAFGEIAPWVDIAGSAWWTDVLALADHPRCPPPVQSAVDLLDGIVQRDAARIERIALSKLESDDDLFQAEFLALAGAYALELRGASARERHEYVLTHMAPLSNGRTSLEVAFQTVRAYVDRSGD